MERLDFLPLPDRQPKKTNGHDSAPSPAEVRVLTEAEVESLRPIFEANGATIPHPQNCFIVGAIENGEVVAFLTVQVCVHAEPMWIAKGHEGLFSRIVSETEKTIVDRGGIVDVYLFAPAGRVAQLAQLSGMRVEPWVVLSKRVGIGTDGMPIRPVELAEEEKPDNSELESKIEITEDGETIQ